MSNPRDISSANVSQFGFQTDFYPMDKKIVFDITGLTEFINGGINNVAGIAFTIKDPSGVVVHAPDWSAPDIVPAVSQVFTYNLSSGFAMYGWWIISGTLKDQDGQLYDVNLKKEVSKPGGIDTTTGMLPAEFKITANCDVPSITVSEITNLSYCGMTPAYVLTDGVLYYPRGTLDEIPFSMTPFVVSGNGRVYTGTYTVRSKSEAVYDLGDYVLVHLTYAASKEQKITCTLDICRLLCCLQDLQQLAEDNCNNATGRNAKEKLAKATIPLMTAIMQDKCGQNSSEAVQEVYDLLGCDCECEGEVAQPMPIGGNQTIGSITGLCATEVIPSLVGNVVNYQVKTKSVSVGKSGTDMAFKITTAVTDCGIQYVITFDYIELSRVILTTIKNSTELSNLLNSIVSINLGFDFSVIDGKCIADTKTADYSLSEKITGVELITGILMDSIVYNAQANLLMNNQVAISAWLNSLGKGAFNVYYNPLTNTTLISSSQNKALVSTLNVTIDGVATARAFVRVGVDIYKFLQAMVNYTCALSANQVTMGKSLSVCGLNPNGTMSVTPFTEKSLLIDYLTAQNDAQCKLVQSLINISGLNCDKIKAVFVKTSSPFLDSDTYYGTKDGKCAPLERKVVAQAVLNDILADPTMYAQFCKGVNSCSGPAKCFPVTNVTVTVDNGVACTTVVDIEATVD